MDKDMSNKTPIVSVLLPVYNGERHLTAAVESILRQSYSDFELLIIDDGSTDNSADIISRFRDPRILLYRSESNLGLVAALNLGLSLARGKYIARMDADDISLPERLARQVSVLDARSEIGVCGCWWRSIDEKGKILTEQRLPIGANECRSWFYLYGEQPIGHPCVMYRTRLVKDIGGYESKFRHAEDFRLWTRLVGNSVAMVNIPEFLFMYRVHAAQVSAVQRDEQRRSHNRALAEFLSEILATNVDCCDADLVRSLDFRPEKLTSYDRLERLLELKLNSINFFYLSSNLTESSKYSMNVEVIAALSANLAATTLAPFPAIKMLCEFSRKLNHESLSAASCSATYTIAAVKNVLLVFMESCLRKRYEVMARAIKGI